jgi:hypothetical protein
MPKPRRIHQKQLKMYLDEVGMWSPYHKKYMEYKNADTWEEPTDTFRRTAFEDVFGIALPGVGNRLYEVLMDLTATRKSMRDAIKEHTGQEPVQGKIQRRTLEQNAEEYKFRQERQALAETRAAESKTITGPADEHEVRVNSLPQEAAIDSKIPPSASRPAGPVSYRDSLEWVGRNLGRVNIMPEDAPDEIAYGMWETYHPIGARHLFWQMYNKAANLNEDGERDSKADDRKLLNRLGDLKHKVLADIKKQMQEMGVENAT